MAEQRHHFRIEARFGPQDLFLILKKTCEALPFKPLQPGFDFDWLKRRVEISAASREGSEKVLDAVLEKVREKLGPGLLLPGEVIERDGRFVAPIGVLLQTPDVYVEIITRTLLEMGFTTLRLEHEGTGFSLAVGGMRNVLPYRPLVMDFPLPAYMQIVDEGIRAEGA